MSGWNDLKAWMDEDVKRKKWRDWCRLMVAAGWTADAGGEWFYMKNDTVQARVTADVAKLHYERGTTPPPF